MELAFHWDNPALLQHGLVVQRPGLDSPLLIDVWNSDHFVGHYLDQHQPNHPEDQCVEVGLLLLLEPNSMEEDGM